MKERPIIFSGDMVRAILEGLKTMTRRIIKPQPAIHTDGVVMWPEITEETEIYDEKTGFYCLPEYGGAYKSIQDFICSESKYLPGDQLGIIRDSATVRFLKRTFLWRLVWRLFVVCWVRCKWVEVERVQDISEEDAKAEGVCPLEVYCDDMLCESSYRIGFESVWNTLHGPGTWDRNDWVWCLEFRRVEK